jgi:uncharacterized protein with PIN domain
VKLVADAMLGRLATWLRALGLDVAHDPRLDDSAIVELAAAEGRTLLTRDRRLVQRRRARPYLLIEAERVEEQVVEVLDRLALRPDPAARFARCLRCNEPLREVAAAAARARVPPYVAATQQRFRECPRCRRIYWRATHVARMAERLDAIAARVGTRD